MTTRFVWRYVSDPATGLAQVSRRLGPNLAINLMLFAGFMLVGKGYLYFVLWVLPFLTWELMVERIRNIGEHGAVTDNNNRLKNTRTIQAGWLERMLIAPYFVNFHLEHHLLVSCPCYRLKTMHQLMLDRGLGDRMELQPGYAAMLKVAASG